MSPSESSPKPEATPSPAPVQKRQRQKRTRTTAATGLTIEAIQAILLPMVLTELPGFAAAWQAWTALRHQQHRTARSRWVATSQIEAIISKLAGWHTDGLDVLDGLQQAHERGWQGFRRDYLKPRAGAPTAAGVSAEDAWDAVRKGLRRGGVPGNGWEFFPDNPAASAATWTAITDCARWSDLGRMYEDRLNREVKRQFIGRFCSPDHLNTPNRSLNHQPWRATA